VKRIVILLLLLSACSWSPKDKALFTTYSVLNVVDMAQTNEIFHNEDYYEINPVLAEGNFIPVMIGTNVLLYLIADWLPEKYRTYFLGGMIGIKVGLVGHNYSIGIRF